jgi:hypothetical protein
VEHVERDGAKIGEGCLSIICKRLDTLHDTACLPGRNQRGFTKRASAGETMEIVRYAGKIAGHPTSVAKFAMGPRVPGAFDERLQGLT